MKSTGVVRRIDELGRLVIPKEIRKTFKIREGDSIEFFIDENRIMLEKYSLVNRAIDDITSICFTLQESMENTVLYVYEDAIVCGAGKKFDEFQNQNASRQLKSKVGERIPQTFGEMPVVMGSTINYSGYMAPVIVNSDLFGSFVILSDQRAITEQDIAIITILSKIVTRQQEV